MAKRETIFDDLSDDDLMAEIIKRIGIRSLSALKRLRVERVKMFKDVLKEIRSGDYDFDEDDFKDKPRVLKQRKKEMLWKQKSETRAYAAGFDDGFDEFCYLLTGDCGLRDYFSCIKMLAERKK